MKKLIITFVLLTTTAVELLAQKPNGGIYKTYQDYQIGIPSIVCNCNTDKIKLNHFFAKNYIDVINHGKKLRFNKNSLFGYRDCKQNDFRFFNERDKEYKIVENKSIVIYVADFAVISSSGKTRELIPKYFFSTSLTSAIQPLTVLNLKKAFPDNLKFHDLLDIAFGDGTSISVYDMENKMFKINFLLSKSNLN